ncbi:DNA_MISMATCH_REPAIR_2 domain-containing protein, partial [Haematococcus lacustris]
TPLLAPTPHCLLPAGPNTGGKTVTLKTACSCPWNQATLLAPPAALSSGLPNPALPGTDPVEGAALARAILDHLASRVALTLATTHHAELKHAVDEDSKFTNVSMEFDVASLQPTYRLMWGTAGASNALDIAQTLGFDSTVLAEAREVARSTLASQGERSARMAATAASLMEQLEDATAELNETRARRQAGEAAAQQLQEELRELAAAEAKL